MTEDASQHAVSRTIRIAGRDVVRIGLGTNRLTETEAHVQFIREAIAAGIGMIDTARLYTRGESERAVGSALRGESASCLVATKGGYQAGEGRPEALRAQVEQSLRALQVEVIDLYYLHRVDPQTPLEESLGALRELRDAGTIRHVGISAVNVAQIDQARAVLPIAAVQNHYNLRERGHDDVVDHCARLGIPFVPYFPLRESHPALQRIAARRGVTESQVTLAWLLRRSPMTVPIPGSLSIEHVKENLAALDVQLDDRDDDELSAARG